MKLNEYIEQYYNEVDELAKKYGGRDSELTMEQFMEIFTVPLLVRLYKLNLDIQTFKVKSESRIIT